jgi:hypothetical protein
MIVPVRQKEPGGTAMVVEKWCTTRCPSFPQKFEIVLRKKPTENKALLHGEDHWHQTYGLRYADGKWISEEKSGVIESKLFKLAGDSLTRS